MKKGYAAASIIIGAAEVIAAAIANQLATMAG